MKTVGSIILGAALGVAVGFFVWGTKCASKGGTEAAGSTLPADVGSMNEEELAGKLSTVMLPDDEYNRLLDAIHQTAMGMIMAEIQDSGAEVSKPTEDELKAEIAKHFSRDYFTKLNSEGMKGITKDQLISILGFYHSEAGMSFLRKSPEIIQATMKQVQTELSSWLPSAVDGVVTKIKGGKGKEGGDAPKGNEAPTKG